MDNTNFYNIIYNNTINWADSTTSYNTTYHTSSVYYQPFTTNYVYDTEFVSLYSDDLNGLKNYIYSTDFQNTVIKILSEMCEPYSDQDFEDNLYSLILDLINDFIILQVSYFPSFWDEEKYPYRKLNDFIQLMIDEYHSTRKMED